MVYNGNYIGDVQYSQNGTVTNPCISRMEKNKPQMLLRQREIEVIPEMVMTNRASHGRAMALIEIDGLPNFKMVIFHGYVK